MVEILSDGWRIVPRRPPSPSARRRKRDSSRGGKEVGYSSSGISLQGITLMWCLMSALSGLMSSSPMWSKRMVQAAWSRLPFSQLMAKPSSSSSFTCSCGNESEFLRAETDTNTRVSSSCATMLTGESISSSQGCSTIS